MADFLRREIITKRVEYVLRSPTNVAELGKAFAAAEKSAQSYGRQVGTDDWLTVLAQDDSIVMTFDVETS